MVSRKEPAPGHVEIALELLSDTVDAGAELTLYARASSSPPSDLSEHTLKVKDEAGADQGALELTGLDDEVHAAGELTVKAPVKTGNHVWSVLSPAFVKDGVSYAD